MPGWTVDGSADDGVLLRDATDLLRAELPDPRLTDDTAYLRWCYRDNPLGRAWERYHYVDGDDGEPRLVAHYLNYPRRYRGPGGTSTDGAWSQHAVTRSGHQRERHFTRLSFEIFEEAAAQGRTISVGVTNAKSTGAVVKYIGWTLIGPLPVRVVPPIGPRRRSPAGLSRRMVHVEATDRWLESQDFDDLAAMVDRHPVAGWTTDWSPDVLRWRLACPFARYWAHISDDVALITTRTSHAGVPATAVLKVFPLASEGSGSGPSTQPVQATAAVRAATRHHRCAFAVYAGFNAAATVSGVAPPRRLQPSPLNLIIRSLDKSVDARSLKLDTFELLDMDAY